MLVLKSGTNRLRIVKNEQLWFANICVSSWTQNKESNRKYEIKAIQKFRAVCILKGKDMRTCDSVAPILGFNIGK